MIIQKWLAVAGQESEIRFIPLLGNKNCLWPVCGNDQLATSKTSVFCKFTIFKLHRKQQYGVWAKNYLSLAINLYTLQTTQKHSSSESFHFIHYWKIILLVFLTLKENQITVPMLWLWSDHLIYSPRVGSQENENYHIALI